MTEQVWLIIITLLIILISAIIYLITYLKNNWKNNWEKLIQDQLFNLTRTFDSKLSESNKLMSENINKIFSVNSKIWIESNKQIENITEKLIAIEKTNNQIKDIWWQLEWLESILKNPKQRWILWEYFLENVLKNILPPNNYCLQYKFKKWEIVDAVIFIKKQIIPIDSKFSLENYNKIINNKNSWDSEKLYKNFRNDLKRRIDETNKYIKPEEWTLDFAFMFIPSEWVYYDLLINKIWTLKINTQDLIEYAFKEKRVIIVSPTSFYAYLQTVMQWLKALEIEETAKDIQKQVWILWKHLNSYEDYFKRLWNSLWTTINHYNNAYREFWKVDKDILQITNKKLKKAKKIEELEKPEIV